MRRQPIAVASIIMLCSCVGDAPIAGSDDDDSIEDGTAGSALGGTPVRSHAALIVDAVRARVADPLDRLGIAIDRTQLDALLAPM